MPAVQIIYLLKYVIQGMQYAFGWEGMEYGKAFMR